MHGCLRFLWNRAESGDKNAPQIPTPKTRTEKAVYAALGGPNFDSFSSSAALNHAADSSQAPEIYQRSFKHEATAQENEVVRFTLRPLKCVLYLGFEDRFGCGNSCSGCGACRFECWRQKTRFTDGVEITRHFNLSSLDQNTSWLSSKGRCPSSRHS